MLQYPTKSAQTAPLFLSRATRPIIYFAVGLSVGMWFLAFSVQMGISAPAQLPATQVAVYTVYGLVHKKMACMWWNIDLRAFWLASLARKLKNNVFLQVSSTNLCSLVKFMMQYNSDYSRKKSGRKWQLHFCQSKWFKPSEMNPSGYFLLFLLFLVGFHADACVGIHT